MEDRITKWQWAGLFLLTLAICFLSVVYHFGWHSSTTYSCVVCQSELKEDRWLGVPRRQELENDCSRWINQQKGFNHPHVWVWDGFREIEYPLWIVESVSGASPSVWRMKPSQQLTFMQGLSPDELETFLTTLQPGTRIEKERLWQEANEKISVSK
jgi:hypothetical protein